MVVKYLELERIALASHLPSMILSLLLSRRVAPWALEWVCVELVRHIQEPLSTFPQRHTTASKKKGMDSDELTGWWTQRKTPRFAEIMADDLGCMKPEALTKQIINDKALYDENNKSHQIILLANCGTTFVGGCDDILALS